MGINYLEKRQTCVFDTECLPDYWSIAFKDVEPGSRKKKLVEMWPGRELDTETIAEIMREWRVVSFNGINYDIPMILYAMSGADTDELKAASDLIIQHHVMPWTFRDRFNLKEPKFIDHIDLYQVNPGHTGLKMAGARMHSKRLQSMPIHHDTRIEPHMRQMLRDYVWNDADTTIDLFHELKDAIRLREELSDRYGIDLRSKSDAQIAETLIKRAVEERKGRKIYKPDIVPGPFEFERIDYVHFESPELQAMERKLLDRPFVVKQDGYVEVAGKNVTLSYGKRQTTYKTGIGGLHSQESRMSVYSTDTMTIEQDDVTGYYPNMIIKSGGAPRNMRGHFQPVFQGIVRTREEAKAKGKELRSMLDSWSDDELIAMGAAIEAEYKRAAADAEGGKIQSNGTFGKTGSPSSVLYAPEMMIRTTVGGQLSIFMLIESFELNDFEVISANTDGIVTLVPNHRWIEKQILMARWEELTGLQLETTEYKSIHARDVNNYIAIPFQGKPTRKGIFAQSGRGLKASSGLKKSPENPICADAVVDFLTKGTPIESTIRNCQDIRQFLCVAQTTKSEGIQYEGKNIGKVARWYYSVEENDVLRTMEGKTISDSRGAKPAMELPDELPRDIDYDYYIRFAHAMLDGTGVDTIDPSTMGKSGIMVAKRDDQKTYHLVDRSTAIALCGVKRKDRRDLWLEAPKQMGAAKICGKCQKASDL